MDTPDAAIQITDVAAGKLKDLLAAQQDVRAAHVDLQTVTQKLQALKVEMDSDSTYWLKAPHDGVIVKAEVTPGASGGRPSWSGRPLRPQPRSGSCSPGD